MKHGLWIALLFSLLPSQCALATSEDFDEAAFQFLWKQHLNTPTTRKVLRQRKASQESDSVRVHLDRLIAGDLWDQDRDLIKEDFWAMRPSRFGNLGDSPVPDFSPHGGYGLYDITGRDLLEYRPSGSSVGLSINMRPPSKKTWSAEQRRSNESAETIRKNLLEDARLMQHDLRAVNWELSTIEELRSAVKTGDSSPVTKQWLENSERIVLQAEQRLSLLSGLPVETVAKLLAPTQ